MKAKTIPNKTDKRIGLSRKKDKTTNASKIAASIILGVFCFSIFSFYYLKQVVETFKCWGSFFEERFKNKDSFLNL